MKILLVRHGQSHDDIIDAYGGWADFPLTDEGRSQILKTAEKIRALNIEFEAIFTSPLIRAKSTAEIIAENTFEAKNLPITELLYLKERNTYGLLCGVVKSGALRDYPELVEAYEKGEYVIGQEREQDIAERIKIAWSKLTSSKYENIIAVTHGVFLKALFPEILGKKLAKKEDGGMILLEVKDGKVEVLQMDGIEVGE